MHPSSTMKRVIGGKVYNVATATPVASDEFWDGRNFERHGRNTFLYRTPRGAFFEVNLSQWQGERNTIIPLTRDEAMALYDELPEHELEYEQAFGEEPGEPEPEPGRPPLYGETMIQISVRLPAKMNEWLNAQSDGVSGTVRKLIETAIGWQAVVAEQRKLSDAGEQESN